MTTLTSLDVHWALRWITACAATAEEHRAELTALDRAIGDADHGENIHRGFQATVAALDSSTLDTPADVLKKTAATLISTVGGASGPLLGTAFMRMAKACTEPTISPAQLAAIIAAGLGGIQARGKAEPGEKTMVDVWHAVAEVAQGAADEGAQIDELLRRVAEAAHDAAENTIPLKATKGRASYLGERSVGHKDPGAASSALFFAAAYEAATTEEAS